MKSAIAQMLQEAGIFHNPELFNDIVDNAKIIRFDKDEIIIDKGDELEFVPIVLSGCIRIIRSDDEGNEVFLYHLYPGQTCTLSLSSCQARGQSLIKAIAEDFTEILQIPVQKTMIWNSFPEWKAFIDNNYQNRLAELIQVIDLIAFSNMDKQLHHYIEERCKANHNNTLEITHQQIAEELHTHREAISRLLRTMEIKKIVKLGRNNIELLS